MEAEKICRMPESEELSILKFWNEWNVKKNLIIIFFVSLWSHDHNVADVTQSLGANSMELEAGQDIAACLRFTLSKYSRSQPERKKLSPQDPSPARARFLLGFGEKARREDNQTRIWATDAYSGSTLHTVAPCHTGPVNNIFLPVVDIDFKFHD